MAYMKFIRSSGGGMLYLSPLFRGVVNLEMSNKNILPRRTRSFTEFLV